MMAIIVKKIFLGWPLLFALLLPSCGQVCIMGQGECPTVNVETKLTLSTSQPTTLNQPINEFPIAFQINGGAPSFNIKAKWTTSNLGRINNEPNTNSNKNAEIDTNASNFNFVINGTSATTNTPTVITSQEIITITAEDKNGKTASATITINPAPTP